MRTHTLLRKQTIRAELSEVWAFFSSPENLDLLTPPNMGFDILTPRPLPKMYENQEIEYKVRPLLNIPLYWKTKITEVEPNDYFIDEQLKGPYSLWKHKHTFREVEGHVTMTDQVDYALPLGVLGSIAHKLYVKSRLKEIFDYRAEVVDKVFT